MLAHRRRASDRYCLAELLSHLLNGSSGESSLDLTWHINALKPLSAKMALISTLGPTARLHLLSVVSWLAAE